MRKIFILTVNAMQSSAISPPGAGIPFVPKKKNEKKKLGGYAVFSKK